MKHTPGSWFIRNTSNDAAFPMFQFFSTSHGLINEHQEDNAKFIVHACNCHEKLLDALKAVVDQYEKVRAAEGYPTQESESTKRAKQAIAKAEGKE